MKLLGVITARGGSKGIPGKNLKLLAGRPLLDYPIETARRSGAFDRLILSTDDAGIAEAARRAGCDVPFLRPPELARDETPHLPVLQHAVAWLREHDGYDADAVMILQPTSPLRGLDNVPAYDQLHLPVAERVATQEQVTIPHQVLLAGPQGMRLIADAVAKIAENRDELRRWWQAQEGKPVHA